MTPEKSQSSEELQNNEAEATYCSSSSLFIGGNQIRIKDVSEINSNEAEAEPSSPSRKRKLLTGINSSLSQEDDSSLQKKPKTAAESNPNDSTDPQPSTSNGVHDSNDEGATEDSAEAAAEPDAGDADNTESAENGAAAVADENAHSNEAEETNEAAPEQPKPDPDAASTSGASSGVPPVKIKTEPADDEVGTVGHITPTSTKDIKPAAVVKKEEATSSTTRESCKFGIRCYRRNPAHRIEEAHPGDKDYRRPDFPAPPDGTPACPYGDLCYRRNPMHFQQFSHPPSTDFEQNWKNYKMRLRERKKQTNYANSSYSDLDDDEYDLDDPFIDDGASDEDFIPGDDDDVEFSEEFV